MIKRAAVSNGAGDIYPVIDMRLGNIAALGYTIIKITAKISSMLHFCRHINDLRGFNEVRKLISTRYWL
jgi:hypothetical protein